ncbi:hypothetical protein IFR05_014030 [Cadophora sp. M221]|nr:hypothetical protein IFR05_014030 [Cadophora sp. M221]
MATTISFSEGNSGLQGGIFNGPVNAQFHHHAPSERLETPPNPLIVIPFSRDTDFVERGILDRIHQKCAVSGSRTALVGLGGVGNAARFEQSFRDIANCAKIYGRLNPQADVLQLVHDWLRDERKGKWILILDNVDEAGFLKARRSGQDRQTSGIEGGNPRPLVSYLPQCPHGSILVTTRSKDEALKLVERRDIITVEPMSGADGLALFEKKLGWHDEGEDVDELAAVLEYMPLAIVQAAAYISQRVPRYSVSQYLQDFRRSDSKKTSLLNCDGGQLRRDEEAKNSIIITWQISFEHIREIRPTAADLLSLMSFFDRQGIPEALLRSREEQSQYNQEKNNDNNHPDINVEYSDGDEDRGSQSSVNDGFEDDLLALQNYLFISLSMDGTTFEMHGLVQLATREWLKANKQQERWKEQFIKNLCAKLPTGEYENWERCQALFPHAQSAAAQKPKEQDSLIDWTSVLYKAAWYALRMGKGVEAENLAFTAMQVRKKILGDEHEDTLSGMAMVGLAYKLNGQWDTAEKLEVQVMETSKTKLGVNHPNTLTSMANLASTYRNQGRWDDAEKLEVQVMETRKTKLGVDHPDTLTSMNNLASTYGNQGRWDDAEKLEVQVMETSKTKLGVDHPDTLTSMANLAFTWKGNGKESEAYEVLNNYMGGQVPAFYTFRRYPDPQLLDIHSQFSRSLGWTGIATKIDSRPCLRRSQNTDSSLVKRTITCTFLAIWSKFPSFIRFQTYKLLRTTGSYLYGSHNTGIQRLPFGIYLKYGPESEAERHAGEFNSVKIVRSETSIPVPYPIDHLLSRTESLLVTSRIEGGPAGIAMDECSDEEMHQMARNLRSWIAELSLIKGNRDSKYATTNATGGPCLDYRISGNRVRPFPSEKEFSESLCLGVLPGLTHRTDHKIVFTHADLNMRNILVEDGRITGIVDWENAGFFPEYWEYTKCHFGVRISKRWPKMIDAVFENKYQEELEIEKQYWEYHSGW